MRAERAKRDYLISLSWSKKGEPEVTWSWQSQPILQPLCQRWRRWKSQAGWKESWFGLSSRTSCTHCHSRWALSSFFCHPVQVFLVVLGLGSYLTDVGLDADGMIRWLTMTGCHRWDILRICEEHLNSTYLDIRRACFLIKYDLPSFLKLRNRKAVDIPLSYQITDSIICRHPLGDRHFLRFCL